MDENITPPSGETPPPPPTSSAGGHEQAGPRVTGADIRDVSRLRRSTTDRHIAGVAGGLARHLDIDPLLVRIAFVIFTIFGGAGILLYGALWLLVPEDDEKQTTVVDLDPRSRSVALVVVAAVAALTFLGNALGGFGANEAFPFFPLAPLVVIGFVTWRILRRRERRAAAYGPGGYAAYDQPGPKDAFTADVKANPEKYRDMAQWKFAGDHQSGYRWVRDPRKRGPLLFWIVVPLIALALGTLGVFDLAGYDVLPAAYPALALGIVAGGLLLGSFWGRAGGLILLGLLLVPVTAAATVAGDFEGKSVRYTPQSVAEIPADGYHFEGAGDLTVDLSHVYDVEALDGRTIDIDMAVGELTVIVPDDVDVTARAWAHGPGGYEVFGQNGGGIDSQLTNTRDVTDEKSTVRIDATVSVGHIIVRSK